MEILLFTIAIIAIFGLLDLAAFKWGQSSREPDPIIESELATLRAARS